MKMEVCILAGGKMISAVIMAVWYGLMGAAMTEVGGVIDLKDPDFSNERMGDN